MLSSESGCSFEEQGYCNVCEKKKQGEISNSVGRENRPTEFEILKISLETPPIKAYNEL